MDQALGISGEFRIEQVRRGEVIKTLLARNKITQQAKLDMLNQFFKGTSSFSQFYVGLVLGTTADYGSNAPSLATLGGAEMPEYSGNRPAITFAAASVVDSNAIIQNTTSNYVTFTVGADVVDAIINGIFIASTAAKTTPTKIWCTAAFGGDSTPETLTINTGDVIRVRYTVKVPL